MDVLRKSVKSKKQQIKFTIYWLIKLVEKKELYLIFRFLVAKSILHIADQRSQIWNKEIE